jgi:HK97 family phage portal protein
MGLLDRLFGTKTAKVPFVSDDIVRAAADPYGYSYTQWSESEWIDTSWSSLVSNIYAVNSAVGQCILKLAQGYPEPPPMVLVNGEEQENHPLKALLDRPNPLMSHSELMQISIIYRVVGGNAYYHKVRGSGDRIVELWPYHQGQMWPLPSQFGWVEDYAYRNGKGEIRRIPARDIIHLKWPMTDLSAPWQASSPLAIILREVLTDSEATRFTHSLLKNNAMPSGVITLPEGTAMSPQKAQQLRDKWEKEHGGDKRGGIAILEQGASYTRVSMSPDEIDLAPLRDIPESRIAGNLGVPAIVAGLSIGLKEMTKANYEQARKSMTEETFVPMWRSDAVEMTQALQGEFGGRPVVTYNTTKVASLQESTDAKFKRATEAFLANGMTMDEYRALIDLPPFDTIVQGDQRGLFLSYELKPAPQPQMQPRILDITPTPPQLTDEGKAATGDTVMLEVKEGVSG